MYVTVILPTYNRLPRLRQVIAALETQQDAPPFEVVVVSDGSTDGTNEYLHALHTPLRLTAVTQPNRGVAATRNHGLLIATGELVLFVDDDVVPGPRLIAEHVAWHQIHGKDVVVMGPMLSPPDFAMHPWVQWEQAMLAKQYADMQAGRWQPTARQFYTGNTSLRRQHLQEAGGFDASFRRAEDVELAYRLADRGLRFLFNPDAVGYHYAERSFASWIAIPYAYGRNDVIFHRDKGQRWLLPTIAYEFRHSRHALIRQLTRLCLDRPWFARPAVALGRAAAAAGHALNAPALPRLAYSAIFNLRHYQGISDELGGRRAFFALTAAADTPVGPPTPGERAAESGERRAESGERRISTGSATAESEERLIHPPNPTSEIPNPTSQVPNPTS